MDFGSNLFDWFVGNAQPIVLVGIVVMAIYFIMQRKTTELIVTCIVAVIAVGLVFNTEGAKNVMLDLFNTVIGADDDTDRD